jgi:hypothetical protein
MACPLCRRILINAFILFCFLNKISKSQLIVYFFTILFIIIVYCLFLYNLKLLIPSIPDPNPFKTYLSKPFQALLLFSGSIASLQISDYQLTVFSL